MKHLKSRNFPESPLVFGVLQPVVGLLALILLGAGCKRSNDQPVNSTTPDIAPISTNDTVASTHVLPPSITRVDWRKADAEEYLAFIKQLRAQNMSEDQIQALVLADVNRLFQMRLDALASSGGRYEFWRSTPALGADPDRAEKLKKQAELLKNRRELLEKLSVKEVTGSPGVQPGLDPLRQMFSYLPADKATKVVELERKYQKTVSDSFPSGVVASGDQKSAYDAIQRQKDQELARLLTPQEKEDYDLRRSRLAQQLRADLQGFNPTEQEFRDLYRLRQQYEERIASLGTAIVGNDSTSQSQLEAWRKEMEEQVKRVIGEERYPDYQRSQDVDYRNLLNFANARNIPEASMSGVYETQKSIQSKVQQITSDQTLSATQRNQQLAELRAQADKSLIEILGTNAFNIYRHTGPGQWLQSVSRENPRENRVNP